MKIKQIIKIFELINDILPKINHNRKRIISVKYILMQIFKLLNIDVTIKNVTKCRKTLDYYEKWWSDVFKLIEKDINKRISDHIY